MKSIQYATVTILGGVLGLALAGLVAHFLLQSTAGRK